MAAEHHPRVHPVDVESGNRDATSSGTTPLVPRNLVRSQDGDPDNSKRHPYYSTIPPPPPPYQTHPYSKPPRRNGCLRCICWSLCLLLALVVILAITLASLYLIYRPKVPTYSVDSLRVTAFDIDAAFTAHAAFEATVTATNTNKKIGVYYEPGSKLLVAYDGATLCEGKLPAFYQGHGNVTVLAVVMEGRRLLGSVLVKALQNAQDSGTIPLDFKGDVPVRVKFGALKLWKVRIVVECRVVVNSLVVDRQISIRSSSCKFKKIKMW